MKLIISCGVWVVQRLSCMGGPINLYTFDMLTATYRPPAEYQSPSSSRPQTRSKRPTDVRHSDLDLSEVEGGRGYTPAPPPPGNRLVTVKCFRMT